MSEPERILYLLWIAWLISWILAAVWAAPTLKRPARGDQLLYRIVEISGFVLLLGFRQPHYYGVSYLWHVSDQVGWAMVGVTIFGILFAWWARLHLGRLWSGNVTRKEGHRIVDTGPYAIVRHPIYTGLLIAAAALALTDGSVFKAAGFAVLTLGFFLKARVEEKFLRQELGTEAYDAYARRVPMLVPFGPTAP